MGIGKTMAKRNKFWPFEAQLSSGEVNIKPSSIQDLRDISLLAQKLVHGEKLTETDYQEMVDYCRRDPGETGRNYRLRILAIQGGVCAICAEKPTKFHLDHDHKTGKVRGMLCMRCNLLLGYARDNIEILSRAISYLKRDL